MFSVLREITAAFGCPDPHLGLYGAFGYDLAFQFEPVRTSIDRSDDQRDLVLHLPDQIWVVDLRREEALRYSYDFTVAGGDVDRQAARARLHGGCPGRRRPRRCPRVRAGRQICRRSPYPAGTRRWWSRRRSASVAVTSSRSSQATCSTSGARRRRGSTSGCGERNPAPFEFLFNLGDGGVPGRGVAGDVRAGRRRPGGDLPDLRHDRPRRRPARGRGQHRHAARLGQGGVRADHVHRRGPQRQVAGLRPRQRAGDRAAADRDVQPADPHGRPHRGTAAAGIRRARRVPHPHVGRHGDRRAEGLGHAVHRGQRGARGAAGTAARSARSASTAR